MYQLATRKVLFSDLVNYVCVLSLHLSCPTLDNKYCICWQIIVFLSGACASLNYLTKHKSSGMGQN